MNLKDVDLAVARCAGQGIDRHALDPFDALVERLALQDPEAADGLLGLGERAVDDVSSAVPEGDPGALRAGLQTFGREPHSRAQPTHRCRRDISACSCSLGMNAGLALAVRLDQRP